MKHMTILILAWLCLGAPIPPPCHDRVDVPFDKLPYDPNKILDRKVCVIGAYAGQSASREIIGCDPDGDPMTLEVVNLPENATFDANSWTINWSPDSSQINQVFYVYAKLTDHPPDPNQSLYDEGTILLYCLKPNEPPILGCR